MAYNARWVELTRRVAAEQWPNDPAMQETFFRLIQQESGFDDDVVLGRRASSAGAQGIAQFMPATARGMGVNPLDPEAAARAGARYLAQQIAYFGGDVTKGTAAYNAGAGNVERAVRSGGAGWTRFLPAETQSYLQIIRPASGGGGGAASADPKAVTGQPVSERTPTAPAPASAPVSPELQAQARLITTLDGEVQAAIRRRDAAQPGTPEHDAAQADLRTALDSLNDARRTYEVMRGKDAAAPDPTDAYNAETARINALGGIEAQRARTQIDALVAQGSLTQAEADLIKNGFEGQAAVARLTFDLLDGNRKDKLAEINSLLARGQLRQQDAANLIDAIQTAQAHEIAKATHVLAQGKWIADERRKNAMQFLPPEVQFQPGFEPNSPMYQMLRGLGYDPEPIRVAQLDPRTLDPVQVLRDSAAAARETGVRDTDYAGVAAARTVMGENAALPTYRATEISPEMVNLPAAPNYDEFIAALRAVGVGLGGVQFAPGEVPPVTPPAPAAPPVAAPALPPSTQPGPGYPTPDSNTSGTPNPGRTWTGHPLAGTGESASARANGGRDPQPTPGFDFVTGPDGTVRLTQHGQPVTPRPAVAPPPEGDYYWEDLPDGSKRLRRRSQAPVH